MLKQLFAPKLAFNDLESKDAVDGPSQIIDWLRTNALDEEGLFRKPGTANEIEKLTKLFAKRKAVDLDQYDCHTVASVLKKWIREMPNPITTYELYDAWLAGYRISDRRGKVRAARACLKLLPAAHRRFLAMLVEFFTEVAAHADKNLMTPPNIAIVFGPNMFQERDASPMKALEDQAVIKEVLVLLIEEYHFIFVAPSFTNDMMPMDEDAEVIGDEQADSDLPEQSLAQKRRAQLQRQPTLEESLFLHSLRHGALSMVKSMALTHRARSMESRDSGLAAEGPSDDEFDTDIPGVSDRLEAAVEGGVAAEEADAAEETAVVKETAPCADGVSEEQQSPSGSRRTTKSRPVRNALKAMRANHSQLKRSDVQEIRKHIRKKMVEAVEFSDITLLGGRPRLGSKENLVRERSLAREDVLPPGLDVLEGLPSGGESSPEEEAEERAQEQAEQAREREEKAEAGAMSKIVEAVVAQEHVAARRGTRERSNAVEEVKSIAVEDVETISVDAVLECAMGGSIAELENLMMTMDLVDCDAFQEALSRYEQVALHGTAGLTDTRVEGDVTVISFAPEEDVTVEWLWQ